MPRIPNIKFLEQQPSQPNYEFTMPTVLVREPRLMVPGMQPVGRVIASALAIKSGAKLVAVTRQPSVQDCRNLVKTRTPFGTYNYPYSYPVGTSCGLGLYMHPSWRSPCWWLDGEELVTTGPFSVLVQAKVLPETGSYGSSFISNDGGSNQWRLVAHHNGTAVEQYAFLFLTYDGSYTNVYASNALSGDIQTFIGVRSGTSLKLWCDGKLIGENTGTARNVSGSTKHIISPYWDMGKATTEEYVGTSAYGLYMTALKFAFFNTALSDSLASEFSANPSLLLDIF